MGSQAIQAVEDLYNTIEHDQAKKTESESTCACTSSGNMYNVAQTKDSIPSSWPIKVSNLSGNAVDLHVSPQSTIEDVQTKFREVVVCSDDSMHL